MLETQSQKMQSKSPMSEYLMKIQIIVSNTEFKNNEEANEYETLESKINGEKYIRAMNGTDIFESYTYTEKFVVKYLTQYCDIPSERAFQMAKNPQIIPQAYKDQMKIIARNAFIQRYKEPNPYYVMLSGKPYAGTIQSKISKIIPIPNEFYQEYQYDGELIEGMGIDEMPTRYQDIFINTKYYQEILEKYPNERYLQYIGSKSIPIHIARAAKDGDILRIDTNHLSTNHPKFGIITVENDLIHLFNNIYKETRRYVYDTLRGNFADIYPNYNNFIRFLTIYMTIGGCLNELMKKSTSMIYMNQTTANDFFMLYGLPSVIMQGSNMISFLKQFRLILMDKGTNVVYRVKDLIGYEYTDIYTLVMVKQQAFDQNGFPIYNDDGTPKQNIVFRRLGTTEDNTSYFKYRDSKETYSLEEITSGDPRWWNTPEVEEMLSDMNYTLSNSKYIQLSTHMSMSDIYWQCIILLRGLLDNRGETQYAMVDVNLQSNSMQQISVFEAVLILEILMDWHIQTVRDDPDTLQGNMYLTNGMVNGESVCLDLLFNGLSNDGLPNPLIYGRPFQVSSFNFDIKKTNPTFYEGLSAYDYLEPSTFIPMLENVLSRDQLNIGETMMVDVRAIYDYLVLKLRDTRTIHEFRQVSDVFEQLFLVHPDRKSWYYADGESTINIEDFLCDTFHISVYDLNVLCKLMETEYVKFTYDDTQYSLNINELLTNDVSTLDHFDNRHFVNALILALSKYTYNFYDKNVSPNLKSKYREIIITKIQLDLGNDVSGPKTFEALLMRENPGLYRYMQSIRYSTDVVIYAIRAIIRALERYTNASLQVLEFSALGEKEYFKILKEVISYFKSYMVEFSKDEFVYIFDGFYDCGGHPNMLKLFDGENQLRITLRPTDSLTLHDASYTSTHTSLTDTSNTACNLHIPDQGISNAYDEMLIRYRASYKKIKQAGYPILFDDGESIKSTPPYDLVDDESLIFTFSQYQLDNTNTEETGKYIVIHLHQYKRN